MTAYGRTVLSEPAPTPHDPTGYLDRVRVRVKNPDATVTAYLTESLNSFRRGNVIASAVMLGIAAERVFLLVCDSLEAAIVNAREKAAFTKVLGRFVMKPKLDWVHSKLLDLQNRRLAGFPDNATLMITAIYDLLRSQRNDLGHPRDVPPTLTQEEMFANLQIFPRFYQTAEELRQFLSTNPV